MKKNKASLFFFKKTLKEAKENNLSGKKFGPVEKKYQQAQVQLAKYEKVLQAKYPQMKINKMVVIRIGFDRLLGKVVV